MIIFLYQVCLIRTSWLVERQGGICLRYTRITGVEGITSNAEIDRVDYLAAFLGGLSEPAFIASITSFKVMAVALGFLLPIAMSPVRVGG